MGLPAGAGDLLGAWLRNHLGLTLPLAVAGLLVVRAAAVRASRVQLNRKQRIAARSVAGVLFFASWAYVICYVG